MHHTIEDEVREKLADLDGEKATVEIEATDNASETIDNATTSTYGLTRCSCRISKCSGPL